MGGYSDESRQFRDIAEYHDGADWYVDATEHSLDGMIELMSPLPESQVAVPRVRGTHFRQISDADLSPVAGLLAAGFPRRGRRYWDAALHCLARRQVPEGFPRYGHMLVHEERPVGVLLLIYAAGQGGDPLAVRCNVSSWYVEAGFRQFASMLVQPALRQREVTFINTSPAENTVPVIEAQGFRRFSNGTFLAVPALARWRRGVRLVDWQATTATDLLHAHEVALLRAHAAAGCTAMVLRDASGHHPFVFRRRMVRHRFRFACIPCAQLIYARDCDTIARCAHSLGRQLALRGMPMVLVPGNGAIAGVPGVYFDGKGAMYYRGQDVPAPCDIAYTEGALFGG